MAAALIIGHPGHELRVYGWVAEQRPLVTILSDGSGRTGIGRVHASGRLLRSLDARRGATFGALSDAKVYAALMHKDAGPFLRILDVIADELVRHGIKQIACDRFERYNPTHDLAHLLALAAMKLARRDGEVFDFTLIEAPQPEVNGRSVRLGEAALAKKLAAAHENEALSDEVSGALAAFGADSFREEWLRPVCGWPDFDALAEHAAPYETIGEQRVSAGAYRDVLRFSTHFRPVADALIEHAEIACAS